MNVNVLDIVKTLINEPNASFEIKLKMNNNVINVVVSRIDRDTYLITLYNKKCRKSRYLYRYNVLNYIDQLISNMKPLRVIVNDLRR